MGLFQYNYSTSGRGISAAEAGKRSYFGILWRRLAKLTEINAIFILASIVQIAAFLFMILPLFITTDAKSAAELAGITASILAGKNLIPIYLFIPFMLMGPAFAGLSYVCRNFTKQDPVFVWGDFWEATRTNLWQSLFASIIISLIYYIYLNASLFYLNSGINTILVLVIVINLGMFITLSTFYVYPIMVTFDMKLRNIFKNSFILSFFNLPQNIAALLSIIAVNSILIFTLPVIVWIIFTFVFLISWAAYTTNYVAWTAIDKFLINK